MFNGRIIFERHSVKADYIKFLINYDSDKLKLFPDFYSWDYLYTTLEDVIDEIENDQND